MLDQHVRQTVHDALEKKGLEFIACDDVGPVHLPGKKAYVTPADVRGIKVGIVTSRLNNEFWKAMGAYPMPTTVPAASSSMLTALIDPYPTPDAFSSSRGWTRSGRRWPSSRSGSRSASRR